MSLETEFVTLYHKVPAVVKNLPRPFSWVNCYIMSPENHTLYSLYPYPIVEDIPISIDDIYKYYGRNLFTINPMPLEQMLSMPRKRIHIQALFFTEELLGKDFWEKCHMDSTYINYNYAFNPVSNPLHSTLYVHKLFASNQ